MIGFYVFYKAIIGVIIVSRSLYTSLIDEYNMKILRKYTKKKGIEYSKVRLF